MQTQTTSMLLFFETLSIFFLILYIFRLRRKLKEERNTPREKVIDIYSIEPPNEDAIKRKLSRKGGRDIVLRKIITCHNLGCSPANTTPLWKIRVLYHKT